MKKILPILAVAFLAGCVSVPTQNSSELISSTSEETTSQVSSSEVASSEELISSEVTTSSETTSSSEVTSSEVTSSSEVPSSSEQPSSSETVIIPEPVMVAGKNLVGDLDIDAEVIILEAYVFSTYHGGSLINVATKDGTVSVSYFSSEAALKADMALLKVGDFIQVDGKVVLSTGGDQARAKHILPAAFTVIENPTWEFGGFLSADIVDMQEGFKTFADGLQNKDFGVIYTFTNVKFMTVGSATPTTTGYDYLNYTALVQGKNEILTSTTNYYRIGVYHFTLDASLFNTTDTYTIQAFMIGTNQNLPWSGTSNAILRLGGYVKVITE
jgi:hypothetical protein